MHWTKVSTLMGVAAISGCALNGEQNPHNDVLVFGTSTKFAIDVSAAVQNAALPEFTIGYKRLEAVWMPLKPNGAIDVNPSRDMQNIVSALNTCNTGLRETITSDVARQEYCLKVIAFAGKYVSSAAGINSDKGGATSEMDTYSVFASVGAKGGLGGNSASGSLAQFFATGIAAQRLGANPAIGLALNGGAPAAVAEQQKAAAEQAKADQYNALLAIGATPEQATTIAAGNPELVAAQNTAIEKAKACVKTWAGTPPATLENSEAKRIAGLHADDAALTSALRVDGTARAAIITACQ